MTDELRNQMKEWLSDVCADDDIDELLDEATDAKLIQCIKELYDGGLAQFIKDGE